VQEIGLTVERFALTAIPFEPSPGAARRPLPEGEGAYRGDDIRVKHLDEVSRKFVENGALPVDIVMTID
jgi:hypothetical protein